MPISLLKPQIKCVTGAVILTVSHTPHTHIYIYLHTHTYSAVVETLYCTYSLKLNISIFLWLRNQWYHLKAETPLQAAPSKEPWQIRVQHEAVLEAACQENRSPPGSHWQPSKQSGFPPEWQLCGLHYKMYEIRGPYIHTYTHLHTHTHTYLHTYINTHI